MHFGSTIAVSSITTSTIRAVNLTMQGTLQAQQIYEVLPSTLLVGSNSGAAPMNSTFTLSWQNGAIYQVSSISSFMRVNINDVPTTTNRAVTLTFLLSQGAPLAYLISSIAINGSNTTIRWPSATVPTPTASRSEIQTFTMFRVQDAWTVISQLNSFG